MPEQWGQQQQHPGGRPQAPSRGEVAPGGAGAGEALLAGLKAALWVAQSLCLGKVLQAVSQADPWAARSLFAGKAFPAVLAVPEAHPWAAGSLW